MRQLSTLLYSAALAGLPLLSLAQSGVGINIATPRAGLDVNHDNGIVSTGTLGAGAISVEGAGTRLMWYPAKSAFRAGTVANFTNNVDAPTSSYGNSAQYAWDDINMGYYSTAFGFATRASGDYSFAGGYGCAAAQTESFAFGHECVASGAASVALGYGANTNARQGTFVFADRSTVDALRAGVNQSATWRVSGGFRIFTTSNLTTGLTFQSGASTSNWNQTNAVISTSTGAMLTTSGVWQNASDRNRKHLFEAVSGEDVLTRLRRLPLTSWSYKTDKASVRHLGPMAQDFYRTFGLGQDSLSIGTVDADGVALAGVQALDARTRQQQGQLAQLQAENQALRARLTALEHRPEAPATASLSWLEGLVLLGAGCLALRRR
jgi:hypothetical protein